METLTLRRALNAGHAVLVEQFGDEHVEWWLTASATEIRDRQREMRGEPPVPDRATWGTSKPAQAGQRAMMALAGPRPAKG